VHKILETVGPDRRKFIERLLKMSGFASPAVRSVAIALSSEVVAALGATASTRATTAATTPNTTAPTTPNTTAPTTPGTTPATTPGVTPPLHPIRTTATPKTIPNLSSSIRTLNTDPGNLIKNPVQPGNLLPKPGHSTLLPPYSDTARRKKN